MYSSFRKNESTVLSLGRNIITTTLDINTVVLFAHDKNCENILTVYFPSQYKLCGVSDTGICTLRCCIVNIIIDVRL